PRFRAASWGLRAPHAPQALGAPRRSRGAPRERLAVRRADFGRRFWAAWIDSTRAGRPPLSRLRFLDGAGCRGGRRYFWAESACRLAAGGGVGVVADLALDRGGGVDRDAGGDGTAGRVQGRSARTPGGRIVGIDSRLARRHGAARRVAGAL